MFVKKNVDEDILTLPSPAIWGVASVTKTTIFRAPALSFQPSS